MATKTSKQAVTITPKELAVELFGEDKATSGGKKIRAYLRQNHARDLEMKGSNWALPEALASAVRDRFTPTESDTEDDE